MKKVGVAILGFGTVGRGTFEILTERKAQIALEYGVEITVKAICEKFIDRAIENGAPADLLTDDINDIVTNPDIEIVAECIGGIEPAKSYLLAVLAVGKSIVTSNKELFAKNWQELENTAAKTKAGLYFEATCAGGVPIIRTLTQAMQANRILEIKGIINGTTNYILSRMSKEGASYDDVLADAQALGFAEANPSADVDGFDACYKLSILSSLAFNKFLPMELIYREGISDMKIEDINIGKTLGYTVKLLAIAKQKEDGRIEARVHPVFMKNNHPLSNVNDSFNAIFLVGDNVGDIMLYGRGAGKLPTGSAVVSDIVFCARQIEHARYQEINHKFAEKEIIRNFSSDYYLRMTALDQPGVLSKITSVFAKYSISISMMRQDQGEDTVQVIFVTHKSNDKDIKAALAELEQLKEVERIDALIRVEK